MIILPRSPLAPIAEAILQRINRRLSQTDAKLDEANRQIERIKTGPAGPPGPPGPGGAMQCYNLSTQLDGSAHEFTTPSVYPAGMIQVWVNGVHQDVGADFLELTSTTFRFIPWAPKSTESLVVAYPPP